TAFASFSFTRYKKPDPTSYIATETALVPLVVLHHDLGRFCRRVPRSVRALHENRVNPSCPRPRRLGAQIERERSSDQPVRRGVAVTETIDRLVATDRLNRARRRRVYGIGCLSGDDDAHHFMVRWPERP